MDRAAVWKAHPEDRQLPSLTQWLMILWWTQPKTWTQPQRKMMQRAGRYHAVRTVTLTVLLLILLLTGVGLRSDVVEKQNRNHAEDLVQRLMVADISKVPDIIEEIERYRFWANPMLELQNEKAAEGSPQKLRIGLALLPVDPGQRDYLYRRLLDAEPNEVAVLCTALTPHKEDLLEQFWAVVEQPAQGKEKQRLRAASALAIYDPEDRRGRKPKTKSPPTSSAFLRCISDRGWILYVR